MLRAGVSGRVELWLYVDASGVGRDHRVKTSSGTEELDIAAGEGCRSDALRAREE